MSFQDFTLTPANDPQSTPQEALDAASASALAPAGPAPTSTEPQIPFGISWAFDFEAGQFVRIGQSPAQTSHFDTLAQWCEMTIHTARYASPIVPDDFGMETPDSVIGEVTPGETIADWQRNLVDALMVHDRITMVHNIKLRWDPTVGVLYIDRMDVVTDEDETISLSGVTLRTGGGL